MAVEALGRIAYSQREATETGGGETSTTTDLCLLFDNLSALGQLCSIKCPPCCLYLLSVSRVSLLLLLLLLLGCSPGHIEGPDREVRLDS